MVNIILTTPHFTTSVVLCKTGLLIFLTYKTIKLVVLDQRTLLQSGVTARTGVPSVHPFLDTGEAVAVSTGRHSGAG